MPSERPLYPPVAAGSFLIQEFRALNFTSFLMLGKIAAAGAAKKVFATIILQISQSTTYQLHTKWYVVKSRAILDPVKPKSQKKARDPARTRAEILAVAFSEIYRRGFQAVSVNDIVKKAGLTKGAFFYHFPTKQDLGYALVDETLPELTLARWVRPLAAHKNPLHGIATTLEQIIKNTPESSLGFGCPLNNLIQEMAPVDPVFRRKLKAVIETWISGVEKELQRAQAAGQLKAATNPRQLAEFVVMSHEGAYGLTKSLRDRNVFLSLHASLAAYLKSVST